MTRRLTWCFFFGFVISLTALIASSDQDGITTVLRHDNGALMLKLVLGVSLGGLLAMYFRDHLSKVFEGVLFWALIGLMGAVGYNYRVELYEAANRLVAQYVPGYVASLTREVEVVRGKNGDFGLATEINGAKVPMVLDSGATSVLLTQDAARAAGLPLEILTYSVNVDTANGRMRAAPVTLDRISVGTLTERAVPALVAQPGQLKSNLLGMSFLNRLDSWEVRGDKLRLRGQR